MRKVKPVLFNVQGDDFSETLTPIKTFESPLINEPTGLFTIFHPMDPTIYEFAKLQKQRFWRADEYPIDRNKEKFDELSTVDKKLFKYTLSFLAFLDSVQVANISDMEIVYNMPEYKIWGATHKYFEVEHAIAYSNILYGLFNTNASEIKRIFYLAKTDPVLTKRNQLIANNYQKLFDVLWEGLKNISAEEYARTLAYVYAGTYAMEAVTFYMGFKIIEFYQYKYGVLPMTNKMISEIKADELFHVKVMSTIIKRIKPILLKYISKNEFDDIVLGTLQSYVEADLEFYQYILQNNMFGITQQQIEQYIKYLANIRARLLGYKDITLYSEATENPFEAIDKVYGYLETHNNANKKDSFFETKSTAYIAQTISDEVLEAFEF